LHLHQQKMVGLFLLYTLVFNSCTMKTKNFPLPSQADQVRLPANDPIDAPYKPRDFLQAKIYDYKGALKVPPLRWFAFWYIKRKIKKFLKGIPLDKTVRQRVLKKVKSKDFVAQYIPFLLAMKDMYTAKDTATKKNFNNYMLKKYPRPDVIPGLNHTLFDYQKLRQKEVKSAKGNKDSGISEKFMAKIITLVDSIILADPDFKLGVAPYIKDEVVARTVPLVKDLLEMAMVDFDIKEDYIEIAQGIVDTPHRLEALTVSLIEVLMRYLYKNYQMFARKHDRRQQLEKWMLNELKKREGSKLWEYVEEAVYKRRYGIHIVVDGLQGQLIHSLVGSDPKDPFFAKIIKDHTEKESYRPQNLTVKETSFQQMEFLNFLYARDRVYKNPLYLPFFKSIYRNWGNSIVQNGISTTPTISVRNIPIAMTGAAVAGDGGTHLPNFHYVDREADRALYFFGNDALKFDQIAEKNNMQTLFQRLPHLNSMSCNSMYGAGSGIEFDAFVNIAAGEGIRDFGEVLCLAELERRLEIEKKAIKLRKRLLSYKKKIQKYYENPPRIRFISNPLRKARKIIKKLAEIENDGLPSYLLLYNPWPDHFAHFEGPFSDEIISPTGELNRLDFWLGRITKVYKQAGVYNRTMFGMAGDHGLAPIYFLLNPEVVIFDKLKRQGFEFKIKKISSDEGEGPKLNHPTKPMTLKNLDVVVASTAGGNYMLDFFLDQGANWKRQPILKELKNLRLLNGQRLNIVDKIVTSLEDTLKYLVVREEKCDQQSADILLFALNKNGKKVHAKVKRRGNKVFYAYDEVDLLDVKSISPFAPFPSDSMAIYQGLLEECLENALEDHPQSWCNEKDWRPLLVSRTFLEERMINSSPVASSNSFICRLTADWAICNAAAAFEKLECSAVSKKAFK